MAKGAGRRLPKRIGGVKVPKRLRRRAERMLDWADHPIVSQTIPAALIAGAAAIADGKGRRDIVKAAGLGAGAASIKAAHEAQRIEFALAIAATEIAAGIADCWAQPSVRNGDDLSPISSLSTGGIRLVRLGRRDSLAW